MREATKEREIRRIHRSTGPGPSAVQGIAATIVGQNKDDRYGDWSEDRDADGTSAGRIIAGPLVGRTSRSGLERYRAGVPGIQVSFRGPPMMLTVQW